MTNRETIDRAKAVVDRVTALAEQYTWQSAVITGKDAARVAPLLTQMAINELLRAELIVVALVYLGYRAKSIDPPKEPILIGNDAGEMLEFDRKAVIETIGLCEDALAHDPENGNTGCPVQELFEELCREEQAQLGLLDALLKRSGEPAEASQELSLLKS